MKCTSRFISYPLFFGLFVQLKRNNVYFPV
jgi:hypothetical protein